MYLSTAGLPGSSARVCVGPPLFASGASSGLVSDMSDVRRWQLVPVSRFASGTLSEPAVGSPPAPVLSAQFWLAGRFAMISPLAIE